MLPWWIRLLRLAVGVLALLAVFRNYIRFDDPYFWHFFSNQSNLLAGAVLISGAIVFPRRWSPLWWDVIRGTAVLMLLVTGVVYALLLGGLYNPLDGSHPWSSSVLHQLMPIMMLLDLLAVPLNRRVPMWSMILFALYPLAWLAYTMWYGYDTGWYPYNFLDPARNGGSAGVAVTIAMLLAGFLIVAALIIRLGKVVRTNGGAEPLRQRAW